MNIVNYIDVQPKLLKIIITQEKILSKKILLWWKYTLQVYGACIHWILLMEIVPPIEGLHVNNIDIQSNTYNCLNKSITQ